MAADYWQMGITGLLDVAGSGLLGRKVQTLVAPNPPTAISRPASAPTSAPVAGQQGTNPAASTAGQGHWARNWQKYAIGGGALMLAVVAYASLRR